MENNEKEEKKENRVVDGIKKLFGREKKHPLTAEFAWIESMYGNGSYRPVDERIEKKQKDIESCIRSKFYSRPETNAVIISQSYYSSYHCVVNIEPDLIEHIDDIFKPFIDAGFTIINLSERVNEIADEHVYLISWKKVFNKSKNNKTQKQ